MSTKQKSAAGGKPKQVGGAPKVPPRPTPASKAAYQAKQKNAARVSAPVATSRTLATSSMGATKGTSVPFPRREFLGDVAGSVTFSNTAYSFNPGMAACFPWLSDIAPSFDEYTVDAVKFIYEPAASSANTGSVILSFDYDAVDPPPVDKVSALMAQDNVRTAPWVAAELVLKKADLQKRCTDALFVRTGTVASTDLKTYDLGNLNVSTVGNTGTTQVGELWVEYVVWLRVPQRPVPGGEYLIAASVSKAAPFTGTQTVTGNSIVATATGAIMTFSVAGYYLIDHLVTGTTLTAIATPTASTGSSCSLLYPAAIVTAATSGTATFQCRMLAGGTLTFDDATGNTTVTRTDTTISPWFTV